MVLENICFYPSDADRRQLGSANDAKSVKGSCPPVRHAMQERAHRYQLNQSPFNNNNNNNN